METFWLNVISMKDIKSYFVPSQGILQLAACVWDILRYFLDITFLSCQNIM